MKAAPDSVVCSFSIKLSQKFYGIMNRVFRSTTWERQWLVLFFWNAHSEALWCWESLSNIMTSRSFPLCPRMGTDTRSKINCNCLTEAVATFPAMYCWHVRPHSERKQQFMEELLRAEASETFRTRSVAKSTNRIREKCLFIYQFMDLFVEGGGRDRITAVIQKQHS